MITRRGFVVLGTAASAVGAPKLVFFTASEAALVTLIAEQIIPKDHDPGATDAGVVYYIDQQLAGPLNPFATLYREQLPTFDSMLKMPFAEQTDFLKSIEKANGPAARLFAAIIDHTMQGFYGPPSHGGNRDEASWKMLGIQHEMDGHH